MHRFLAIRRLLGVTQHDMAAGLGLTQPRVSLLDRGATVTPETAGRLIAYAKQLGVELSYDQIYGSAQLPPPRILRRSAPAVV